MKSKLLKRLTLEDLEFCDGVYNVSQLADVDGSPWVNRETAQEILDMANSHTDWLLEELNETNK
jgi:hypothetical protein